MRVKRFLGVAWASVHGPHDPQRLLVSALEAKFAGFGISPPPRPVDWAALARAAADLPVEFAAVRVGSPMAEVSVTAGLAAVQTGEVEAARRAVHQAAATARLLGCPILVLEPGLVPLLGAVEGEDLGEPGRSFAPEATQALLARRKAGRNAALERVCREVHGLVRALPDLRLALTGGRSLRAVADRAALEDLFADLRALPLGYWHDAAVAARREQVLGEPQGAWLEAFGPRLVGMSLGDASPDGMYLPPGAGGVDYSNLASYAPRSGPGLPAVLELDPAVPPSELPGMRSCLARHGL